MDGYWWAGGPIDPVRWHEMALRRLHLNTEAEKLLDTRAGGDHS